MHPIREIRSNGIWIATKRHGCEEGVGSSYEGEGERFVEGLPRMQEGASAQVDGVEWLREGPGWVLEVDLGWEWFLGGGRPAEGDVVEENLPGWLLLQMDPPKNDEKASDRSSQNLGGGAKVLSCMRRPSV